jgi:hypothetical protein
VARGGDERVTPGRRERAADIRAAGLSACLSQLKGAALAHSERDGKMVMYELTARGRALLTAIATDQARVTPPVELPTAHVNASAAPAGTVCGPSGAASSN